MTVTTDRCELLCDVARTMALFRTPKGGAWRDVWDVIRDALARDDAILMDAREALMREMYLGWDDAADVLTVAVSLTRAHPPLAWGDLAELDGDRDAACVSALRTGLADADALRAAVLAILEETHDY